MTSIIFTVTNDLSFDQRMHRICSTLQKAGYTVTLVGRERSGSVQLASQPYKQVRIRCLFNSGKLFYIEYNIRLLFWLLFRPAAGCYSAVDLDTILPCLFVAKLRKGKLVYDAHEYFTEVPEVINRPWIKRAWRAVESFAVPKTDKAYTVSAGIAAMFLEKYAVKFEVIRNMPYQFPLPSVSEGDFILYQGALNVGRAVEHYIKAMHYIDCKLYIAGEGDLSFKLRALVTDEKLNAKIKFLGMLPPSKLRDITVKAKVGLNCAENLGLSYYHSLNNKTFDYIMAGIPQVVPAFPEFIRLNQEYNIALVADNLEPESLASVINRLIEDSALHLKLKNNCLKARKVLNWQNEASKLNALYSSL